MARSALKNGSGLFGEEIRSRFTFEARERRFRIEQTNLERFISSKSYTAGWVPIGKWPGSGWKKVEAAFAVSAANVAQCVLNGPKREDW